MFGAIVTAVVGAAGAYASADAQKKGAKAAAKSQADAAALQADTQREMYYDQISRYQPYSALGLSALPYYQSALLGGPVQYTDPTYQKLGQNEIEQANLDYISRNYTDPQYQGAIQHARQFGFYDNGDTMRDMQGLGIKVPYDINQTWYRDANGNIVNTAPPIKTANFNYMQSPSLRYQNDAMQRQFSAQGRRLDPSLGGYTAGKLAAEDYYKQLALLGGAIDVGRGVAGDLAGASKGFGDTMTGIYGNVGNANAASQQQIGAINGSLYSGIAQAVPGLVSGLKSAFGPSTLQQGSYQAMGEDGPMTYFKKS